jgi:hypothetical protein
MPNVAIAIVNLPEVFNFPGLGGPRNGTYGGWVWIGPKKFEKQVLDTLRRSPEVGPFMKPPKVSAPNPPAVRQTWREARAAGDVFVVPRPKAPEIPKRDELEPGETKFVIVPDEFLKPADFRYVCETVMARLKRQVPIDPDSSARKYMTFPIEPFEKGLTGRAEIPQIIGSGARNILQKAAEEAEVVWSLLTESFEIPSDSSEHPTALQEGANNAIPMRNNSGKSKAAFKPHVPNRPLTRLESLAFKGLFKCSTSHPEQWITIKRLAKVLSTDGNEVAEDALKRPIQRLGQWGWTESRAYSGGGVRLNAQGLEEGNKHFSGNEQK